MKYLVYVLNLKSHLLRLLQIQHFADLRLELASMVSWISCLLLSAGLFQARGAKFSWEIETLGPQGFEREGTSHGAPVGEQMKVSFQIPDMALRPYTANQFFSRCGIQSPVPYVKTECLDMWKNYPVSIKLFGTGLGLCGSQVPSHVSIPQINFSSRD